MTRYEQIQSLEKAIATIENDYNNIVGGLKSYSSGYQTYLKPAAQKKLDKLNKSLDLLLDECEA
jgi:hypothetical protein